MIYTASRDYGVKRNCILSHRYFTFGETSLVIDKLHFPQENFTALQTSSHSGFHPLRKDFIAQLGVYIDNGARKWDNNISVVQNTNTGKYREQLYLSGVYEICKNY